MLTLRRQPHAKDDRFWMVLCDDVAIGAIVQPGGADPWHWSIMVQADGRTNKNGKSETLRAAWAEFSAAWRRFSEEIGSVGWEQHAAHMENLMERSKRW